MQLAKKRREPTVDNNDLNAQVPISPQPAPSAQVPTPATPITPPAQPVMPQAPVIPVSNNTESKKPILWLIIGAMLVLVVVGGIYLYLSQQQALKSKTQTMVQTPTASPQENLEGDLNSIDVNSSASSDFAPVDSDLQQL